MRIHRRHLRGDHEQLHDGAADFPGLVADEGEEVAHPSGRDHAQVELRRGSCIDRERATQAGVS